MTRTLLVLNKITKISLYALIFIIPFSKAGIEIFATAAIVSWLLHRFSVFGFRFSNYFPDTPLNKPVFALFIISFVSMIFSADLALSLEGVFFKLAEYILLFFICADIFSEKRRGRAILLGVLAASCVLLFVDAGYQWVTGTDFIRGFTLRGLKACFSNPNDFAGYIVAVLPVLYCAVFLKLRTLRPVLRFAMKAILAALYLSGAIFLAKISARGALLGYLVSIFFFIAAGFFVGKRNKEKRLFLGITISLLCALLACAFVFTKPIVHRLATMKSGFGASTTRLYQWKEALAVIEDFPVLGTGPNTYTKAGALYKSAGKTGYYPHNAYLHMGAETGILGLWVFLWIVWRFFWVGLESLRRAKQPFGNNGILLLGVMAGIMATLTHSFFDTNLFALRLVTLFWLMLGAGTALIHSLKLDAQGQV